MPYPLHVTFRRLAVLMCYALLGAGLLIHTAHAQADDELMQRVHQFLYEQTQALGEEVVIDVRPPSPHLPPCIRPEPFLPNAGQPPLGRVSVGVRCGEAQQQIRYLQAQIDVIGGYWVAQHDIERGTLITQDMLARQSGSLSALSSQALIDEADILGKIAQRPIRSGSAFQANALQTPALVKRGQRVTVIAQGSSFRVAREGEALEDGGLGDRVRVRFESREILTARVTEQGILVVDF
ncbi:flagella basal body P-ring formation protein FlgA [Vreelandella songnenensis]|uniref:Flagella basal body P-ring formation protein FlgA n=1 Tax=Vreelandella songnenensis TaxID=1176243 RepID=A0A2T0V360_9GAMM|nr:flagellar basal body P-ring formation chaperone FlgA [Halomonas songnenensis]PRY64613.1 flagella basal body P-ring formation protein FlgA [Halomonas songnenensis]